MLNFENAQKRENLGMELYDKIISIVDFNLIYCLVPMVLTLILVKLIYKNRFPTKKALNVIRWIIIGYTVITLVHFIVGISLNPDEFAFTNRATGPYKFAYWFMLLCVTVLPFTLLFKKLASKYWYVLIIAFLIKVGVYFERFVIVTTSMHRDYAQENGSSELMDLAAYGISVFLIQGLIIAIILLGILKLIERKKSSR